MFKHAQIKATYCRIFLLTSKTLKRNLIAGLLTHYFLSKKSWSIWMKSTFFRKASEIQILNWKFTLQNFDPIILPLEAFIRFKDYWIGVKEHTLVCTHNRNGFVDLFIRLSCGSVTTLKSPRYYPSFEWFRKIQKKKSTVLSVLRAFLSQPWKTPIISSGLREVL